MADLTTSQKFRIALTVFWGLLSGLIAGGASNEYSSFDFGTFIAVFVILNILSIIYWLGYWIWGDGYIFKAFSFLFSKIRQTVSVSSLFIILTSLLIIFFVSNSLYKTPYDRMSYHFGETIGSWLVLSLIAYVLFRNRSWFKNAQLSPYAIIFLVSAVSISFKTYKENHDDRSAMMAMATNLEENHIQNFRSNRDGKISVKPINIDPSNKLSPLFELINDSRQGTVNIFNEYTSSFPHDFQNYLVSQTFSDSQKSHIATSNIRSILLSIPYFRERVINHFNTTEAKFQNMNLPQKDIDAAKQGFKNSKQNSLNEFKIYFDIQEGLLENFLSLLFLMKDANGLYEYNAESDMYYFANDHHLVKFNEIMASISKFTLLEKEWGERAAERDLSLAREIRNGVQ